MCKFATSQYFTNIGKNSKTNIATKLYLFTIWLVFDLKIFGVVIDIVQLIILMILIVSVTIRKVVA